MSERRLHLVLSGGGVKCISYAGAIARLVQEGFSFASVSTVSAGTFIGAWLCAGVDPSSIEETLIDTDLSNLLGGAPRPTRGLRRWFPVLREWRAWPFSLYSQEGIVQYFEQLVPPGLTLGELRIPFATAGVDLINDRILVYSHESHPDMLASDAVRIAMALPLLFPPHQSERRLVVDASIASNSPVWLAVESGDTLPIVVLKPSPQRSLEPPASLDAYIARIMESGVMSRDHYILSQVPRVHVVEIETGELRFDQFDITREQRQALISRGEDAAAEAVSTLAEATQAVSPSREPTPPSRRPVHDAEPAGESSDQRAERYGTQKMRAFVGTLSMNVRHRVFLSYSKEDLDWLDLLRTRLYPYVRNSDVTVWDDTQLQPGTRWEDQIREALRTTKVAVLLVTPNFLASDFIVNEELGHFLHAQETEGLVIIWIAVSAGAYDQVGLSAIQAANNPERPLDTMKEAERNQVLDLICRQILRAVS